MPKLMGNVGKRRHRVYDAIWLGRSQAVEDLRDKPLAIFRRGIHCHCNNSEEDIGTATGKSVYCKGQVREIGVLNDDLDATPTHYHHAQDTLEVHTSVPEYSVIGPFRDLGNMVQQETPVDRTNSFATFRPRCKLSQPVASSGPILKPNHKLAHQGTFNSMWRLLAGKKCIGTLA